MDFIVEKDEGPIPYVFAQILDACVTGITISDPDQPDNPIIYANAAFERVTGYPRSAILGHNCRFLHAGDWEQPGLDAIRTAIRERRSTTVALRNYRQDGELFINQFTLQPLFDRSGELVYFLGIQYDVTDQVRAEEEVNRLRQQLGTADSS